MARCCRESKKLIKLHKFYFSLGILACFEKEKVFSLIEFSIKKSPMLPERNGTAAAVDGCPTVRPQRRKALPKNRG